MARRMKKSKTIFRIINSREFDGEVYKAFLESDIRKGKGQEIQMIVGIAVGTFAAALKKNLFGLEKKETVLIPYVISDDDKIEE